MKTSTLRLALYLLALNFYAHVSAGIPAKRYNPDFNSSDPYGLAEADLDYVSDSYDYCKFGNVMDEDVLASGTLRFSRLTAGPFSNANTDLFLTTYSPNLSVVPFTSFPSSVWNAPTESGDGKISLHSPIDGFPYRLFRKLHFTNTLTDEISHQAIDHNTKKVIVLIHGWNPDSNKDSFGGEFASLITWLKVYLQNSPDWKLVLYRWEPDADTGPRVYSPESAVFGSKAAEIAHRHGQNLGELLDVLTQQRLEKVHFIAHSAGSWAAKGPLQSIY